MNKNYKKITSFETACEAEGLDAVALVMKWKKNGELLRDIAGKKLEIFIKAINGKWKADITNASQKKIYGFVAFKQDKTKPAGFGFSNTITDWTNTGTGAGSRLFTETTEQMEHAFKYGEQMFVEYHCW
ncbi:MAG: hypothetical protein Q8K66_04175 [Sediminibacterium sp.]|nr:hypothetical protein [Sediminibacterium sp.]MDP3128136.1 hypothetical protein [Sediminibacterium sp.]